MHIHMKVYMYVHVCLCVNNKEKEALNLRSERLIRVLREQREGGNNVITVPTDEIKINLLKVTIQQISLLW